MRIIFRRVFFFLLVFLLVNVCFANIVFAEGDVHIEKYLNDMRGHSTYYLSCSNDDSYTGGSYISLVDGGFSIKYVDDYDSGNVLHNYFVSYNSGTGVVSFDSSSYYDGDYTCVDDVLDLLLDTYIMYNDYDDYYNILYYGKYNKNLSVEKDGIEVSFDDEELMSIKFDITSQLRNYDPDKDYDVSYESFGLYRFYKKLFDMEYFQSLDNNRYSIIVSSEDMVVNIYDEDGSVSYEQIFTYDDGILSYSRSLLFNVDHDSLYEEYVNKAVLKAFASSFGKSGDGFLNYLDTSDNLKIDKDGVKLVKSGSDNITGYQLNLLLGPFNYCESENVFVDQYISNLYDKVIWFLKDMENSSFVIYAKHDSNNIYLMYEDENNDYFETFHYDSSINVLSHTRSDADIDIDGFLPMIFDSIILYSYAAVFNYYYSYFGSYLDKNPNLSIQNDGIEYEIVNFDDDYISFSYLSLLKLNLKTGAVNYDEALYADGVIRDTVNKMFKRIDSGMGVEEFKHFVAFGTDYDVVVETKNVNGTDVIYTGGTTKIYNGSELIDTYVNVVNGDTNGDGILNMVDYVKVYNHIYKTFFPSSDRNLLTGVYKDAADMSGDGSIAMLDYVKIYNYIKNNYFG